ncbi:GTP-binding protein [Methanobacterium aggregans]|uniref:GTP-binding protein n=1 Tax=Methanobacterium aggregans TaxID=1615586 RepID=UPI001AE9A782|nr:GTP-binding protein [Methanobacterium aggregans]MBP2045017.1 small GTP-binding protein [Methanobacterium aggregans]
MTRKKETKIVILGSYNSGKTTTLENLCNKKTKVEYNGTTIALDYGNIRIDGEKVHIFGSPGQERFEFMREILSRGLDGAILVIDSQKGVTSIDEGIINNLNQMNVPYVVFANKQDLNPETEFKGIGADVNVVPTIATECKGVKDGLDLLYTMIKN